MEPCCALMESRRSVCIRRADATSGNGLEARAWSTSLTMVSVNEPAGCDASSVAVSRWLAMSGALAFSRCLAASRRYTTACSARHR
eukprot:scaffold26500_cov101-Isochrysis_galbana.AAC.1